MYAKIIQAKKHKNLLPQNQMVFQTPQVWLWCQVIVTMFSAKWLNTYDDLIMQSLKIFF